MVTTPLSQPLATLMRPTARIAPEDSVELAARRLRENGSPVLPIVENGRFFGAVSESSLADALGRGVEPTDEVTVALDRQAKTIAAYESGAEALRAFEDSDQHALIVVDDELRVLGILAPSDLIATRVVPNRPALIGGMATPFGVYLTTGNVRAGAGDFALMATGAVMALIMVVATFLTVGFQSLVEHRVAGYVLEWLEPVLQIALFAVGMRLIPLSGIHAAEHKVVHAIERGEELVPETVRRMPRVHPRCGTNLAVGAAIFLGISMSSWIPYEELRLIVALLATLMFWRPLGALAQRWITTRTPNERQIQMGIRSGRELLHRYAHAHHAMPNIGQRIWNSGMLQVIVGSSLCFLLIDGATILLGLDVLPQ